MRLDCVACVAKHDAAHTCVSFFCWIGLDRRRFGSVPRAVASVASPSCSPQETRSLPLAVLARTEYCLTVYCSSFVGFGFKISLVGVFYLVTALLEGFLHCNRSDLKHMR